MVKAEMSLLRRAEHDGNYSYYHLLSGMDLPLKTQDEIHTFFRDEEREFVAVCPGEGKYQLDHVRYAYPLLRLKAYRNSKPLKAFSELLVLFQRICGVKLSKSFEKDGWHFYDGWNWFSVTDKFVKYVLANEKTIEKIFHRAKAPDEMFLQTLIMNSPFKDRLACIDDRCKASMRLIDWKRGKPYIYREEDFEELVSSPYLFARKFDERLDGRIIDKICSYLKKEQH